MEESHALRTPIEPAWLAHLPIPGEAVLALVAPLLSVFTLNSTMIDFLHFALVDPIEFFARLAHVTDAEARLVEDAIHAPFGFTLGTLVIVGWVNPIPVVTGLAPSLYFSFILHELILVAVGHLASAPFELHPREAVEATFGHQLRIGE